MTEQTIRVWELASGWAEELHLPDHSNLDAITRQLPDGFYSTFRTYGEGRRVVGLQAHLARLYVPAREFGLKPACSERDLRQMMDALLRHYRPAEARLRIMLDATGGRVFVAIQPLVLLPREAYEHGVRAVILYNKSRKTPNLKTTNFIAESQAERASLAERSAFEGLLARGNRILEGMTSNFFYVWDGVLGTASKGVLHGVTRSAILRLARRDLRIPIRYRALRIEEIVAVQEAFISSSSRGIVPVVQIDEVRIGAGVVGPVTVDLMHAYERDVLQCAEDIV